MTEDQAKNLKRRFASETKNQSPRDAGLNVVALRPGLNELELLPPRPSDATVSLVRRLRHLLQQSVLKPRQDWDKACMLIAADPHVTLERYAFAFFHGLEVHGRRKLQFFVPQADDISTDEMWMVRLITQLQAANLANARYLIALRINEPGRRLLLFLASGLADWLVNPERQSE